jgi:hypothetical protein
MDTMSGITVVIIVAYLGREVYVAQKNGTSLLEGMLTNIRDKITGLAVMTTGGEIISLIITGVQNDMNPLNAFIRFGTLGVLEILTTFLFAKSFADAVADKIFTPGEALKNFVYFCVATFFTYLISLCYLESIDNLYLYFTGTLNPLNYLRVGIVENPTEYPTMGAIIMIGITPILNLLLGAFLIEDMVRKNRQAGGGANSGAGAGLMDLPTIVGHIATLLNKSRTTISANIRQHIQSNYQGSAKSQALTDLTNLLRDKVQPLLDLEREVTQLESELQTLKTDERRLRGIASASGASAQDKANHQSCKDAIRDKEDELRPKKTDFNTGKTQLTRTLQSMSIV